MPAGMARRPPDALTLAARSQAAPAGEWSFEEELKKHISKLLAPLHENKRIDKAAFHEIRASSMRKVLEKVPPPCRQSKHKGREYLKGEKNQQRVRAAAPAVPINWVRAGARKKGDRWLAKNQVSQEIQVVVGGVSADICSVMARWPYYHIFPYLSELRDTKFSLLYKNYDQIQ